MYTRRQYKHISWLDPKTRIFTGFFMVKVQLEVESKSDHENWEEYAKPIRILSLLVLRSKGP